MQQFQIMELKKENKNLKNRFYKAKQQMREMVKVIRLFHSDDQLFMNWIKNVEEEWSL
ncbi:MAG: hypothetical protein ACOC80_13020 [Petrotogales bacterium]